MESYASFAAHLGGGTGIGYFFSGRTLWCRPDVRRNHVTGEYSQGRDVKIHVFSNAELRAAARRYVTARRAERAAAVKKEARKAAHDEWLASFDESGLPAWARLDRGWEQFRDDSGNFLADTTECVGMTPAQVGEYLAELDFE